MKKKILFIFLLFCSGKTAFGNSPHLDYSLAYVYQYAPAWDKIIQTYNFSRSFNDRQLGLFISGYELNVAWRINLGGNGLSVRPGLSYQRFSSVAKNNDLKVRASINNWTVHSNAAWTFKSTSVRKFSIGLDPACSFLNPSVRVNKKEVQLEGVKKYRELSLAFRLGMELAYKIPLEREKRTIVIRPFLRGDWYPQAELFDFASALNGSYLYDLKDYGRAWQFSAGIRFSFSKPIQ